MNAAKASPAPWIAIVESATRRRQPVAMVACSRADGTMAADFLRSGATFKESAANAWHAARCVNSHDELVAALRELCAPQVFGTYANDHERFQCVYPAAVWERARAALAKVSA